MISVECDAGADWDIRVDWAALADDAARAAVRSSRASALFDSPLNVEISVKLASDAEVRALNAAYRNKDKPTNVLSFPLQDAHLLPSLVGADKGEILLGDVVLAYGVCAVEAAQKHISIEAHAAHLMVHGVLHLLGYDHVAGEGDADEMEAAEREALAAIGIADPYAITEVQA